MIYLDLPNGRIFECRGARDISLRGIDEYRDCIASLRPGTIIEDQVPGLTVWVEYIDDRGYIQTDVMLVERIESLRFDRVWTPNR